MELTGFDPRLHGFGFANDFETVVVGNISVPGLCAGMSLAALGLLHGAAPGAHSPLRRRPPRIGAVAGHAPARLRSNARLSYRIRAFPSASRRVL